MDDIEIENLDREMNAKDAFYYEKAKLYLTEHYIINFSIKFKIVKYDSILWMYQFEQRTNGIKTSQINKSLTNDGRTSTFILLLL